MSEPDLFGEAPEPVGKAIKALSLTQPWATLLAIGAKHIETRGWKTHYRGSMAIHASKGFPADCRALCAQEPFLTALAIGVHGFKALWQNLPLGCVLAIGELFDVVKITAANGPGEPERSFGDYTPGRYAWHFRNVVPLDKPVPAKGMLQLWDWSQPSVA